VPAAVTVQVTGVAVKAPEPADAFKRVITLVVVVPEGAGVLYTLPAAVMAPTAMVHAAGMGNQNVLLSVWLDAVVPAVLVGRKYSVTLEAAFVNVPTKLSCAEETVPVGPVAPLAPVGPAGPGTAEDAPVGPTGPATVETAPVGPVGPELPVEPVAPVTPLLPLEPVAPVDPVAPLLPLKPVAPVGPTGPATVDAAPEAPVGPVGPATVDVPPVGPVGPLLTSTTVSMVGWLVVVFSLLSN